jgi:iron complex outermembrane receptor protein
MRADLLASACAAAIVVVTSPASAQDAPSAGGKTTERSSPETQDTPGREASGNEIIVTATRREERIQDVPLSITAFSQEELTEKGIVGFEGIGARDAGRRAESPTANFNNFTARGIATNGYNANLQSSVAVYIDELPVSTIGNTTVVDPNLFDVERVEFLRGPQGTLFGSGSLSGAMRILRRAPTSMISTCRRWSISA